MLELQQLQTASQLQNALSGETINSNDSDIDAARGADLKVENSGSGDIITAVGARTLVELSGAGDIQNSIWPRGCSNS